MPSIIALRPHWQEKCHATPYIMEFDHFVSPALAGRGPRGLGKSLPARLLPLYTMRAKSDTRRYRSQRRLQTPHVSPLQAAITQQHHSLVTGAPAHLARMQRRYCCQRGVDGGVDVGVVARGAVLHVLLEHRPVRPDQHHAPIGPDLVHLVCAP
jgi:hypothetical protein